MDVIGYIRVSTEEQSREGVSLDAQEERIRAFCTARDWTCLEVIADEGKSGGTLDRPGLRRLITKCEADGVDGVVVLKLDRLTRSVRDLGYLIDDVFQAQEVAFTSVQDNFDTTTANGRLVLNILATVAQWERDIIAERTQEAMDYLKTNGRRCGQLPFGFDLGDDGTTLVRNEGQQRAIERMQDWRMRGMTYREIADRLTAEGVPTQMSGTCWKPTTIWGILERVAPELIRNGPRGCLQGVST